MKRILIAFCFLSLALPAFSQSRKTQNKETSGVWLLEDGKYLHYESDVFVQISRDREAPPDGNYVYSRWCDMTDVDATYISPEMFKLVGYLPKFNIQGKYLDLSDVITELKGLYMLEFAQYRKSDPGVRYCRNGQGTGLRWDIRNFLEKNHYKTLMDMRENGQYTRLYMTADEQTVTGIVLVNLDDSFDYGRFICLEGKMPYNKFQAVIKQIMQ